MDISNDALKAAEKAFGKLMNGIRIAKKLQFEENNNPDEKQISEILSAKDAVLKGMNDDFNTAQAIAALFQLGKKLNLLHTAALPISALNRESFEILTEFYPDFIENVLGLREEKPDFQHLLDFLLAEYKIAKEAKDYAKVDALRAEAKKSSVVLKDMKNGIDWAYEE
jgi:cysteinyl-tRNA synthetase